MVFKGNGINGEYLVPGFGSRHLSLDLLEPVFLELDVHLHAFDGAGDLIADADFCVIEIIGGLKDLHKAAISAIKMSAAIEKRLNKIIDGISWLVFSDTVLLTLPIEEKDPFFVKFSWMAFLMSAIMVQGELFQGGLPSSRMLKNSLFENRKKRCL